MGAAEKPALAEAVRRGKEPGAFKIWKKRRVTRARERGEHGEWEAREGGRGQSTEDRTGHSQNFHSLPQES